MQLHTWWPFMETTHRLCGWSKHAKTDCDMADGPETAINHRLSTIIWPIHASRCSGCFVPPAPSPFQVSTPSPPQKGTFQQCQHVTVGFCIFGSSTKSVDGVHERLVHQGNYSLGYKHVSANNADHPQTTWLVQTYGKKMWHNTSSWSRKILKHNLYMTENASPNTTTLAQPCRPLTSLMAFVDQVTLLYFLNVRLYSRSVVMAEDQPTASKPVKDGTGPMVLIRPSPAPDSTCITTNRHHSRDDYFSPWPQCVQWLGRQHAGSRDCYCESVFCNATTTVCDGIFQIKPIWALIVSKVDNCCSVLVGISGHLLNRLQSVLDLCRPTCVLRKAFWTNHATPLRHRLVASSRVDTLPPLCSEWCTVVWMAQPCRSSQTASIGQPTSTAVVTSTRRLRQLVFLPVRRSTPGDWAFPVAAPWAWWNSLQLAVRATPSFLAFTSHYWLCKVPLQCFCGSVTIISMSG